MGETFYRGTNPGDSRRIKTGNDSWDNRIFVTSTVKGAKLYGSEIEIITAKPGAKILKEGSREFNKICGKWKTGESMGEWAAKVANKAEDAGYDAVYFTRQTDIGTAIINPSKFNRNQKGKAQWEV
jgi:hypothetical protein